MFHESINFGSGVSPKREIKIGIWARGGAFLPPLAVMFHKNLISDFSCMQEVCSAHLILSISLASVSETTDQTLSRMYFSLVLYLKKYVIMWVKWKGRRKFGRFIILMMFSLVLTLCPWALWELLYFTVVLGLFFLKEINILPFKKLRSFRFFFSFDRN